MGFFPQIDTTVIKCKLQELFISNVPQGTPSYSDLGKSFAISSFVLFILTGVDWILVQLAGMQGMGWWGVGFSFAALILHHLILFFQRGSEAKVDAVKAAVVQAEAEADAKNDRHDDPPTPPPLRIVG